jgi:proteic killer suppression protein
MIKTVRLSSRARKDLAKVPVHIVRKLSAWVSAVEQSGLESVRKVPSYHDEPLKGRRQGQRSIRLSLAWRAIYGIAKEGSIEFVSVEEGSKHGY